MFKITNNVQEALEKLETLAFDLSADHFAPDAAEISIDAGFDLDIK